MKCIYKIIANNEIYIGSTKHFTKRKNQHFAQLRRGSHHNFHLQKLYNNKINLTFNIIEELPDSNQDYRFEREKFWINSLKPTLNIGSVCGGDNITNNPNREDIIKRRMLTQRKTLDAMTVEERKTKWGNKGSSNNNWKGGKTFCKCGTRINSTAKSCSKCQDRSGLNNPFYGKNHSEQTKKLLSEKRKGVIPSNAKITIADGIEYQSMTAAAAEYDITASAMYYRVKSLADKWKEFYYK